jgi:dTDP-4-dehydrorhamnose 3,5-epimerase
MRGKISMKIPPETNIPRTFVEGTIEGVVCKDLKAFIDPRGWLMEIYREDELAAELLPKMAYLSETLPGISRGPHEHRCQTDYFAFLGPGDFCLYLWDIRTESPTYGKSMRVMVGQSRHLTVIVPPGVVHAYKNISDIPGWVINLPNQLYGGQGRKELVDEIRHENDPDLPFSLS